MSSGDLAKFLVRLGETREQLERQINQQGVELGDRVTELDGVMADIRAALEKFAARQQAKQPEPIEWDLLDDDTWAQHHRDLVAWIRRVLWRRYPLVSDLLTPCWAKHPDVRDALTTAWHTWTAAHDPAADPQLRAIWQWSYRDSLARQLGDALRSCTDEHNEPTRATNDVIAGEWPT